MSAFRKSRLPSLFLVCLLLMMFMPTASAGRTPYISNVTFACVGNNLVITWIDNVSGDGEVNITWNGGNATVSTAALGYTILGPGTFTVTVTPSFGAPVTGGPFTCGGSGVVGPTDFCYTDGRVNRNCGATVQVFLTEVEEGWNMLLIGLVEDLGQKHVFLSFEVLNGMEPGDVLEIGIVTLELLPDGTWLLIAPRENGKPYYLHFNLAGPGKDHISDGDLE